MKPAIHTQLKQMVQIYLLLHQYLMELRRVFHSTNRPRYGKGACVIRMMSNFIGKDTFWKGLQQFVQTHKYSTVTSEVHKNSFYLLFRICGKRFHEFQVLM